MKLAKNTALERNLERQVPIYMAAGDAQAGIKAIIFFTDQEERRATGILDKLGLLYHKDIVLIDARADNKPSGSKGSVAKIVWTTTAGSSCAVRTHKGLWRAGSLQQSSTTRCRTPEFCPRCLNDGRIRVSFALYTSLQHAGSRSNLILARTRTPFHERCG